MKIIPQYCLIILCLLVCVALIYPSSAEVIRRYEICDDSSVVFEQNSDSTGSYYADEYFPRIPDSRQYFIWYNDQHHPSEKTEKWRCINEDLITCYWDGDESEYADGSFGFIDSYNQLRFEWYGFHHSLEVGDYPHWWSLILPNVAWPSCWMILPQSFSIRDFWSGSGTVFDPYNELSSVTTVVGEAEMVVPAGTYQTICIETEVTSNDSFVGGTRRIWLAENVGLVKMVYLHNDGSTTMVKRVCPDTSDVVIADFSSGWGGMATDPTHFTDWSLGNPTSWQWDFGDGTTSNAQNPDHIYMNPGQYTVTLSVSGDTGSDSITKTDYLNIGVNMKPYADFSVDVTSGDAPLTVQFSDTSTNSPSSWTWSFGDGWTSSVQNPVHTYNNPGIYDVTLIAENWYGTDGITKTNYIVVYESEPPKPDPVQATRAITPKTISSGSEITVTASLSGESEGTVSLKETVPSGWSITPVSSTADSTSAFGSTREWKWNGATSTDSVSYRVSIPANTPAGTYIIGGTVTTGTDAELVSGDATVTVTAPVEDAPEIKSVTKTYCGCYFTNISLDNTYTLATGDGVDHVTFDVNGVVTTDSDGSDGWGCTLDMGDLDPGTAITITAYSPGGVASTPSVILPEIVRTPQWFSYLVEVTDTQPTSVSSGDSEQTYKISADLKFPKKPVTCLVEVPDTFPMGGTYGLDLSGTIGGSVASDGTADLRGGGLTEIAVADNKVKLKGLIGGVWEISKNEEGELTLHFREAYVDLNGKVSAAIPGASYKFGIGSATLALTPGLDGKLYFTEVSDGGIIQGLGWSSGKGTLDAGITGTLSGKALGCMVEYAMSGGAVVVMTVPPPELNDYYVYATRGGKITAGVISVPSDPKTWRYPEADFACMALSIPPISSSEWEPIPRDYLIPGYGRFSEPEVNILATATAESTGTVTGTLVDPCYPYASPALITLPDGRLLLLWTHDVAEKPQMQGQEIRYVITDGAGWATPRFVTDNLVADFDALSAVDGNGNVIALWSTINDPTVTADTPMSQVMNATDLSWSRFIPAACTWSEPELLTNNSIIDWGPSLSAGEDGRVAAVWIQDHDGDLFTSGDQDILCAVWNGTGWTAPARVAENLSITTEPVIASPDTIAWVADTDDNADTRTDRELFVATQEAAGWGMPVQITANSIEELDPVFQTNGGEWLAWVERDEDHDRVLVVQTTAVGTKVPEVAAVCPSANELSLMEGDTGNLLAVWQGASENGQDIFVSVRDAVSGRWSGGSQVTYSEVDEWQISPTILDDGQLAVAYLSTNESSALSVLARPIRMDCAVDSDDITYADGTLSAVIRNVGDLPAEEVDVIFTDGAGGPVIDGVQTIATLPAGEIRTVSVVWEPVDDDMHEIVVTIDPYATLVEVDTTNNEATAAFFLPDLEAGDIRVGRTSPAFIEWSVANTGVGAAYGIPVKVADLNGSVIDEQVITGLQPGEVIQQNTTWDWSMSGGGLHIISVAVDPEGLIPDADSLNNEARQQVLFTPDLLLNTTSLDVTVPESGPVLLNVTVWNTGDSVAENVTCTVTDGADSANSTVCGTGILADIAPGEDGLLRMEVNLSAGLHTIRVRAENDGPEIDCSNNLAQTIVSVVRVPDANFSADITGVGAVQFMDSSANTPTVWLWDFGDGTSSDAQDPLHTYATDGVYTVMLTVCNEYGSDTQGLAEPITITGVGAPVQALGYADVVNGSTPLTVSFTDLSQGNPKDWLWTFGDGEESTGQHPVHVYREEGNYSVHLRVCNCTYTDECTLDGLITVLPGVAAAFGANITSGVAPLIVSFDDDSRGPVNWRWDFGDGEESTEQSPVHCYASPGNYTVTLTINSAVDTCTKERFIQVTPILFGDANMDDAVNQADTLSVLKAVVGISAKPAVGTESFECSDVHHNGAIDVGDAMFIAQHNVGLRNAWYEMI